MHTRNENENKLDLMKIREHIENKKNIRIALENCLRATEATTVIFHRHNRELT